jgi:predicted heme/steroid binding protein
LGSLLGIQGNLDPFVLFLDIRFEEARVRKLTLQELAQYNGQDGAPAYIAYQGKVYDVTGSFLWRKGRHQVVHRAGQDLTDDLALAPHGDELLRRVPIIGALEQASM